MTNDQVHYQDATVTLLRGRAADVLRTLPERSIHSCVTSPPYFGLRSYLPDDHPDKPYEIGSEDSPADYIDHLVEVFGEVRRVLVDDGTLWVNLGDSYASGAGQGRGTGSALHGRKHAAAQLQPASRARKPGVDLPRKSQLGLPWRVALALMDDGWTLRKDIVWAKANSIPESVTDRPSSTHEYIFLFAKSDRYFFDLGALRQPHKMRPQRRPAGRPVDTTPRPEGQSKQSWPTAARSEPGVDGHPDGRNPGSVWTLPTAQFKGGHFAVMPPELARRAVVAGCPPEGVVLDPFSGSATTGMVAEQNGRKYIGIDLVSDFLDLSLRTRLRDAALSTGT